MPSRNPAIRRHRGISAVVTTVMLVSAVSIFGSFLIAWSSSSFANERISIAKQADERVNFVRENFVIEDSWFFSNATGKYANVTVRNTGDTAVKISHIYINNTQAWNAGKMITSGSVATISLSNNWGSGKPQSIWVESDRGTEIKQVWRA